MLNRLLPLLVFAGAILAGSSGCALIAKGRRQQVSVSSVPAGAAVIVNGMKIGRTPLSINLPRKNAQRMELRKPGFAPGTVVFRTKPNEYAQRAIRFGMDIDSGAANDLTPSAANLDLVPQMLVRPSSGDAFAQMTAAAVAADELRQKGTITPEDHRYIVRKILKHFAP